MKTLILAFVLSLMCSIEHAHAKTVYCTNCSNSAMQSLEKALATSQLAELKAAYDQYIHQTMAQLQMVQQNIEQYTNMIQNTVQLPAQLIREVSGTLSQLGTITGSLNTIRNDVVGLSGVFDELYAAQDEFNKLANLPKDMMSGGTASYHTSWDKWSERVDESTKATFQLSGSQLQDMEDSGQLESYINELLSTPEGQQEAIMAGNQLATLQIQEARQLRELVATKFQSDLASQTKQEKEEQYSKELARRLTNFEGVNLKPNDDPEF